MERTRLLVFDLDGTLLDREHRVPPRVRRLLLRLREHEIETTVATGRPYEAVRQIAQELAVRVPMILFNGAVVASPTGEAISERPLPLKDAARILHRLRQTTAANHCYLQLADRVFYTDRLGSAAEHIEKKDGMKSHLVSDLAALLSDGGRDPVKIFSIGPREELERVQQDILQDLPSITCVFSEPDMLEFLGPSVDKGSALEIVSQHTGIPLEAVAAFGDNMNDLAMLRRAGTGIAMRNAPAELRAAADRSIDTVLEVLEELERDRRKAGGSV